MIHVNTFDLSAAYTANDDDAPTGRVVGQDGNAVLLATDDGLAVVSRPFADGYIYDVLGSDDAGAPYVPLGWAFGN